MHKSPLMPTGALAVGLLLAGCGQGPVVEETPTDSAQDESTTGTCVAAGPQSPRDIDRRSGENPVTFAKAPPFVDMNLCDIHFHRFAEHRAAGYPTQKGSGEHAGYVCQGREPAAETHAESEPGAGGCSNVALGDSIEVHWVFTTCDVEPGPGLDSCFSPVCTNPQLRVEAKVFYLSALSADEERELDFARFAATADATLPAAEGSVEYLGSTTGPSFNDEECSEFQVTWNVRPACSPLSFASLNAWCDDNVFREEDAHGVRELVSPLELLSKIE